MRPSWSGMISFGLVNIPVRAYAAARDESTAFHQIHKDDTGRVRYQKVCKVCGNELQNEDIVKGYEYKKNEYVVLEDEELDKIDLPTARTISIGNFADAGEIDPLQLERAYYIAPAENGERAYALLREALKSSGKAGIGKVVLHNREHLAALRAVDGALVLQTLHFANEMTDSSELGIPAQEFEIPENELSLANVLIDHMSAPFEPAAYRDEYDAAIQELIRKKIEGAEVTAPAEAQPTNVVDIVSALKASLAEAEAQPREAKRSA